MPPSLVYKHTVKNKYISRHCVFANATPHILFFPTERMRPSVVAPAVYVLSANNKNATEKPSFFERHLHHTTILICSGFLEPPQCEQSPRPQMPSRTHHVFSHSDGCAVASSVRHQPQQKRARPKKNPRSHRLYVKRGSIYVYIFTYISGIFHTNCGIYSSSVWERYICIGIVRCQV